MEAGANFRLSCYWIVGRRLIASFWLWYRRVFVCYLDPGKANRGLKLKAYSRLQYTVKLDAANKLFDKFLAGGVSASFGFSGELVQGRD